MSVTYGFYNSVDGDRTYNAEQMSCLFEGIINDGIFSDIGTCLVVTASEGLEINVGIGRAWFNNTWTNNDSILVLEASDAELLLDRIDAVVLEVDKTTATRANSIKIIEGTASSSAEKPELSQSDDLYQYPLAYITREAGSTEITDSDIENMVGTDDTPFITGVMETVSLDTLLGQWRTELDEFIESEEDDFNTRSEELEASIETWIEAEKEDFLTWYTEIKELLTEVDVSELTLLLEKEEIKRVLLNGFVDGTKEFNDDGTVITSTAADGRTLVKTFTNNFKTITAVYNSASGGEIATMVKEFSDDGTLITFDIDYATYDS